MAILAQEKGWDPWQAASPEVRAFIEGKQPYKSRGKARDDPLLGLHNLWNTEKHRILNPIVIYAKPSASWRSLFRVTPDIEPVSFRWVLKPDDVLKLGTSRTLAVLEFPRDRDLPKVEMNGEIPAQIAVGEGKGEGQSFEDRVTLIRGIVTEAVERFPPPQPAK